MGSVKDTTTRRKLSNYQRMLPGYIVSLKIVSNKQKTDYFKFDFMRSNVDEKQYELTNRNQDTTIVYALNNEH